VPAVDGRDELVEPGLRRLGARLGVDPLAWALEGGEDYELLFSTRAAEATIRRAFDSLEIATPARAVGRVVAGRGARLVDGRGRAVRRPDATFRHFS
jgi:thiamine monophosphate kinase